jgi:hypothetical protein
MSRRIRVAGPALAAAAPGAGSLPGEGDTYFDKVLKYIPADVVGARVAVTGLVSSAPGVPQQQILWVAFAAGLVLTAWWTTKQTSAPGRPTPVAQVVISTGAFAVWVFALGGPFEHVPGQKLYGSLLLILYTLVVARITPKAS